MGKKSRRQRTGLSFSERKRRSRAADLEKVQQRARQLLEVEENRVTFAEMIDSLDKELFIPPMVIGTKSGNRKWKG